nr:nucleotide-binding alpha-beta plait domain-containing protein [Tanacetum cinerariifolium]
MSKAGKRFAFVRFIKVDNVERLVGNLCTLWIGRKHLQANVARFERDSIPSKCVPHKSNHVAPTPTSFVSAVKGVSSWPIPLASSPALVLDDSCMVARDLDNFVMGEVRQFSSINNLRVLLHNEGFMDIEIVYLEEGSDSEAVSDTYFGNNRDAQEHDNEVDQILNDKEVSKDLFNIYDLLNRHNKEVGNSGTESSIPYPPGFTPEKEVEKSDINIQSDGRVIRDIRKEGDSILDILNEMNKVGQTMGFTMDGCTKDMEKIIGSNGDHEVFR